MHSLTLQDVRDAQALVYQHMPPTPQYRWPLLCDIAGCDVWLKHENHTPTGAFKVRGGLTYMAALAASNPGASLVTATRGNHGQSVPYAARVFGFDVTVLVPEGNSADKNAAMQAWGAKLEVHGADFDQAREEAERRSRDEGLVIVPSFHDDLIQGVATYGLEFFEAAPALKTVYVPIGMGSGICSLLRVRDLLNLSTEIVGVVASEADAMAQSFEQRRVVLTNAASTFADGLACRVPQPAALDEILAGAARVVRVDEDEVAEAMRVLYRTTHNIAEGAGAAACAAMLKERPTGPVGVVLTGGNVDPELFATVLRGTTPTLG